MIFSSCVDRDNTIYEKIEDSSHPFADSLYIAFSDVKKCDSDLSNSVDIFIFSKRLEKGGFLDITYSGNITKEYADSIVHEYQSNKSLQFLTDLIRDNQP